MRLLNIHGVGDARLDEYERPAAGPKDVVIRMKACGICGSDLSYIKIGGIPMPGTITALGHEGAGEVLEVGAEVEGIAVGQPVIVNPMMTPGNIGSGGPEGAFTEELLVREARLGDSILPIPEGISYDVAAMCEPLAVAMHGVNRAEVRAGDKVVVFGCGPIGLGMILWLVDRGVTDVVALDLAPQRRARALALGARAALDPATVDLRSELAKLHGEVRSYGRVGVGTDAYIDAAGAPNILGDVIMLAKFHSRMVVTAAYMKPVEVPLGRMLTSEMTITTAMGYPTEMPEVVAAMPRLKDRIASMISHKLPFERVIEGLGIAATPQSAKVMIGFGDNRS
ncbi:MAG: alcohol dehydrogenase catalytic domain-containing protein [Gammaproteobacteria bacterium]|jgi:(R,R)-butanediol dehydrogenase/meso-butanediol dehydrogenase/diacetyl reductase|nr:alcohol dehydrogenase catalytic domain-containing protein [Gammaproteobacteria bacterium]MBK8990629.1 alcohol dehydrogenase catalytic domain-containing protein [Gammaproteobacteria bacterium]MBK9466824.1 alcohol dehydrogenase catalytic domain-containing protein [Gammaproteobacteria bacterium]MBP6480508.1 alcohol dehydrogenase catalytic domain-containing protein [Pseudomonadales bacterium]MBP7911052.1 alcohol dehydrogenase catalytic domain-containing protein [Pseudomonadales bacterium]